MALFLPYHVCTGGWAGLAAHFEVRAVLSLLKGQGKGPHCSRAKELAQVTCFYHWETFLSLLSHLLPTALTL